MEQWSEESLETKRLERKLWFRSMFFYLFFGAGTFLISTITFEVFAEFLKVNELLANVVAWILSVLFSFLTNRVLVFHSPTHGRRDFFVQMVRFYLGRTVTLILEEVVLFVFVSLLSWNNLAVKLAAQVLVIIVNYIVSKLLIFNNKPRKVQEEIRKLEEIERDYKD